ncbi:class C sortase [Longicatena caecimuris]|uniref:class C sortase n=1 Tax=Longicatena caecimuris TaxID=1796635 RepID=UPI0022E66491|nr:class C sortase [Longicatena caecimuris]
MNWTKRGVSICFVLTFLFFLLVMDYPYISRLINQRNYDGVVLDYTKTLEGFDVKEKERYRKEAQVYNQTLEKGNGVSIEDAFGSKHHTNKTYKKILDINKDGVMGIIDIPKLKISLPIYHGTSEEVLQKGAGHLEGTSIPIGGVSTHACISAHRGLPNKKMFTNLDEMKEDDIFLLSIMGEKLAYKVIDVQVVLPSDIRSLRIQKGKDLVTLITCTPYGVNTHRLYVTGERTTYKEDMENSKTETIPWYKDWWWVPVNIVLLIVLGYLLYQYNGSAK